MDANQVLVVEDDATARMILQNWLQRSGYEVILAQDGLEAWSILTEDNPPKLILLDWSIPGVDGIELCRRLRERARPYYPYVLMTAGRDAKRDVALALESGADDYLSKPFEEPDLMARLKVAHRILELQDSLIEDREQLRAQATKDALTGVWTRRAFLDLLGNELERARRLKTEVGLLFLDIDHFKKINDAHGHLVGDLVLKDIVRRLTKCLRSYDFIGRYGGEEFCIALPGCPEMSIGKRADTIRLAVSVEPTDIPGIRIPITVSVGAAVSTAANVGLLELIAVADVALYRAKSAGRNLAVHCRNYWSEPCMSPELLKGQCGRCESQQSRACIVTRI
jgi:diguanylate cyclase (GGDEF)-like protein